MGRREEEGGVSRFQFLDPGPWSLPSPLFSILDPGTLDPGYMVHFSSRPQFLDPGPWTLDPGSSILDASMSLISSVLAPRSCPLSPLLPLTSYLLHPIYDISSIIYYL